MSTISTNTLDTLMVFTNVGKMYKILVDKIPNGDNNSKGINLRSIFPFESNEKVYALDLITKIIESRKNFCYWIQNIEKSIDSLHRQNLHT